MTRGFHGEDGKQNATSLQPWLEQTTGVAILILQTFTTSSKEVCTPRCSALRASVLLR